MKNFSITPGGDIISNYDSHEYFLGDGFFNTLDDIKSIASTVGSVKNSLSGGNRNQSTVQTPTQPSPGFDPLEFEKFKLEQQLRENQRLERERKDREKPNNTPLYVGLGVGALIFIAILLTVLK